MLKRTLLVASSVLTTVLLPTAGTASDGPNGHPVLHLCYVTRTGLCTGDGRWTQVPGVDTCSASLLTNRHGRADAVWIDDSIGAVAQQQMLACERSRRPKWHIFVGVAQGHRPPPQFGGATVIAEFYPYGGTPSQNFWHQSIRDYWGCPPRYGIAGFLTQGSDFHWVGSAPPTPGQAWQEWRTAVSCIPRGHTAPMGSY